MADTWAWPLTSWPKAKVAVHAVLDEIQMVLQNLFHWVPGIYLVDQSA